MIVLTQSRQKINGLRTLELYAQNFPDIPAFFLHIASGLRPTDKRVTKSIDLSDNFAHAIEALAGKGA